RKCFAAVCSNPGFIRGRRQVCGCAFRTASLAPVRKNLLVCCFGAGLPLRRHYYWRLSLAGGSCILGTRELIAKRQLSRQWMLISAVYSLAIWWTYNPLISTPSSRGS